MQGKIEQLLSNVAPLEIGGLLRVLESQDFYTAPCSTKYHLACKGGLALHTYNVMWRAKILAETYDSTLVKSALIAALCHDFCKINFYKEVDEAPTDPQLRYLVSLLQKAGLRTPAKLNKTYAGVLIDFMLHDYKKGIELPAFTPQYIIEDSLPLGHGEKSLYFAQKYIELTKDEAYAIRWHMGRAGLGENEKYAYEEAVKSCKLVSILQIADMEATFLMEV